MLDPPELICLLLGVVVLFGGKKLPELGSGLGKGISEFKKAVGLSAAEKEGKEQLKEGETKAAGETKPDEPIV